MHLDDVLTFDVDNIGDRSFQRRRKFQRETHTALTNEAEVIVLAQIGTQIESIPFLILATYT